jgi:hypothetical protein
LEEGDRVGHGLKTGRNAKEEEEEEEEEIKNHTKIF